MPGIRENLDRLVRIPSISAEGYDPANVRRSAEEVRDLLEEAGAEVRVAGAEDGHPAVIGQAAGPEGAPTVLLYAHHDVQPTGPEELWHTPPFEPVERDGRLFGRGTADDKAGVAVHLAALRAWGGRAPVGVVLFIEGEEEVGSENLPRYLAENRDLLRADAVILADCANWRVGEPALTTSLRGIVGCTIEVRTLDHAVHSGMFGGVIPDALSALSRTLASLHDDRGRVAVPGLLSGAADPLDMTEDELRTAAGVRPGVELIGEGSLTERMWTGPAVSVLGIDAPQVKESSGQLVPSARARVSMRVAPGEDVDRALRKLIAHLEANVPWGAEFRVAETFTGAPYEVAAKGPVYEAIRRAFADVWGKEPVDCGSGGSIPFVAAFAEAFPQAALLLTGVEDPATNAHSENESLHLADFVKACLAVALFFAYLAELPPSGIDG
jgi:acetylornithine deacetylase/succinyl-diaminopimelate desuccinylase-like protein